MNSSQATSKVVYKPVLFIIGAFLISWVCIFALESTYLFGYEMPGFFVVFFDFTKSAAPLAAALFLLGKHLPERGFLVGYIFGERKGIVNYAVTALIFILHFFTFYLFRSEAIILTAPVFLSTFAGQLCFGGGLEEGGWRGYLLPALQTKMPFLLSSIITSVIWSLWHLPYFFIPTSSQYGSSFFGYMFVAIMLGFLLAAIYMLTKSILLCTLFHALSNTLVMTLRADMGNMALMLMFTATSIGGAVICQVLAAQEKKHAAGSVFYD